MQLGLWPETSHTHNVVIWGMVCVCESVRVRVCASESACVRECVRECVRVSECVCVCVSVNCRICSVFVVDIYKNNFI